MYPHVMRAYGLRAYGLGLLLFLFLSSCAGTETGNPIFIQALHLRGAFHQDMEPQSSIDTFEFYLDAMTAFETCDREARGTPVRLPSRARTPLRLEDGKSMQVGTLLPGNYCRFELFLKAETSRHAVYLRAQKEETSEETVMEWTSPSELRVSVTPSEGAFSSGGLRAGSSGDTSYAYSALTFGIDVSKLIRDQAISAESLQEAMSLHLGERVDTGTPARNPAHLHPEGDLVLNIKHLRNNPENDMVGVLLWHPQITDENMTFVEGKKYGLNTSELIGYTVPIPKDAEQVRIPWEAVHVPQQDYMVRCERELAEDTPISDLTECEKVEDCPCTADSPQVFVAEFSVLNDQDGLASHMLEQLRTNRDATEAVQRYETEGGGEEGNWGRPYLFFTYSPEAHDRIAESTSEWFHKWYPEGIREGLYAYEPVDPERRFGGVKPFQEAENYELRICANRTDEFDDCEDGFPDFN